jgi:general secretion pathway protein C
MVNVSFNGAETLQNMLEPKRVMYVFGKICLVAAVFLAHESGVALSKLSSQKIELFDMSEINAEKSSDASEPVSKYKIISTRNIIGSTAEKKKETKRPIKKVTSLKLRLVGTHLGQGDPIAIIENTSRREQDVFQLNEQIFDQAKLVKVSTESVDVEYNGKIETLVLEEDKLSARTTSSSNPSADQTEFSVDEGELNDALANLPKLLSQARAVPYFRNGKSIGMRLFAIRRGSFYQKLGMKNGDILKAVNGNSLDDPAQALKLFEQLRNERSIEVTVERSGEEKSLRYNIQ